MGRARLLALVAGLAATVHLATAAPAQEPVPFGQHPDNPFCLKAGEETAEIYGPTDIGATTGNQRLSVAVNPQGTLSVLRWPSPSYYDQVKYFTIDRELERLGLAPNEGAFSGLALTLRGGRRETLWLRDLERRQRYASDDSDTVVTRFRARRLDLVLEIDDVVPPDADVLMRRHVLRLGRSSPVRSARLIAFANLNPTASKSLLPVEDWCAEEGGTDSARYNPAADAVVWEIAEVDQSTGRPQSVAVAIGASRASDGHQIGADRYARRSSGGAAPQSAYDDAADGELSGNGALGPGEVDSALSTPIAGAPVTIVFAGARDAGRAAALLERWRRRDAVREAARKRRSMLRWMRAAPLPARAPEAVRRLAKRALISLRQAIDQRAGAAGDKVAIVASIATQSPYGQDWIRDGAFFNEALEAIGHPGLVERHNAFYAEVQHRLERGAPPGSALAFCGMPTPDGNWFMTNYADGPDAGIFTWEIDEAAFGLWTLWRHYELDPTSRRGYLERVWPTLRRTAEFLIAFHDPLTGLQPPTACEDDNVPRYGQPTMHGVGPALLALRSATAAASALGRSQDAARYGARAVELERAVDARFRASGGAWTDDFGVGGWVLWPVRLRPYGNERMRAQAQAAWYGVAAAFQAPGGPRKRGQYEAKALLGLAHWHRAVDPAGMERVRRGLAWIAEVQAGWQETGILGEAWQVRDGRVASIVSQPHVWAQVLFYLAAIEAYGRQPYKAGERDRLLAPR